MGAVRGWLLAVIAASLLCALADALMPQGAVKRVGKLVCGLVIMAAIVSPLVDLDVEEGRRWLEECLTGVELRAAELEDTVGGQRKAIIERECAAYIVDKAAELGLTCRARVECKPSEDGLYLPVRTEVAGSMTAEVQGRLIRTNAEDLGVPPEAQIYMEEEEMP